MMNEYKSMWDSHLGGINIAKNRNGLTSDKICPADCVIYQAGPRIIEFEEMEIKKMLKVGAIQAAEAK